jgi:hypothetical protein
MLKLPEGKILLNHFILKKILTPQKKISSSLKSYNRLLLLPANILNLTPKISINRPKLLIHNNFIIVIIFYI